MSQQPKRKRIAPIPVDPQQVNKFTLEPALTGEEQATRPGPVVYHDGPSALPGRRMKADLSSNYWIDYKELLKQNGVDPKEAKARKNAAIAAAKQGKAAKGPSQLPALARVGGSSTPAKSFYGNVVERLERIYAAKMMDEEDSDDDDDEEEEGEGNGGESEESEAEDSGGSSSEAEEDGAGTGAEQSEPGTATDGPAGGGASAQAAGGAGSAAEGGASDAAAAKKRRARRQYNEAYDSDFIDDDDEIQYEKSKRAKPKYQGFWVNKGRVEVELPEEEEPPQRQAPRRAPRPRQPAGQAAAKAKQQQQLATAPGAAAGAAAPAAADAGAAVGSAPGIPAGAGTAGAAAAGTPSKPAKRRGEGDGPQPAAKKRKQAPAEGSGSQPSQQLDSAPAAAEASQPGSGAAAGGQPSAPRGLAALAASLGKKVASGAAASAAAAPDAAGGAAGATAAATAAKAAAATAPAPAAPAGEVAAAAPRREAAAPAEEVADDAAGPAAGPSSQPAGGSAAGGSGGPSAAATAAGGRGSSRRAGPPPTSLDSLIADCVKKLAVAPTPPSDWPQLIKAIDAPLAQVALYLHRHVATGVEDAAALEQLAAALTAAAPDLPPGSPPLLELLRAALGSKLRKSQKDLEKMATTVQKLVEEAEAAAHDARAAADTAGAAAGTSAHSSDDDFAEPAAVPAAAALGAPASHLAPLESKLRSYVNLHRKLHTVEDEEAMIKTLAEKLHVDVALMRRATGAATQRKRQGPAKTGLSADDAQLRIQAASIAREVFGRSVARVAAGGDVPPAAAETSARVAGPGSGAVAAVATAAEPSGPPGPSGAGATAAAAAADAPAAATAGGAGTEEVRMFPDALRDMEQREAARAAMLSASPNASEELLEKAWRAVFSSVWGAMVFKVLCYEPNGLTVHEVAQRARELHLISWPPGKPPSDMHKRIKDVLYRPQLQEHLVHIGDNKYVLRAVRPDAEAVARPAGGRGAGGSAASSPAAPLSQAAREGVNVAAEPPPPFNLPKDDAAEGVAAPSAATGMLGAAATTVLRQAAVLGGLTEAVAKTDGAAEGGSAAAAGGAGGDTGASGEEDVVMPNAIEDARQCQECVEAAARAGADRGKVEADLNSLRPRNHRILVKTLCHAGPAGLKVSDIVKVAMERRFVKWPPNVDRNRSLYTASRSCPLVVHVGNHHYALRAFPGVVEVPKAKGGAAAPPAAGGEG